MNSQYLHVTSQAAETYCGALLTIQKKIVHRSVRSTSVVRFVDLNKINFLLV